jgi:hypothetical protein
VSWSPEPWELVGEAGPAQQTPDLAPVIQEIVSRPGWTSGNALALVITGAGLRVAESFEGSRAGAPELYVVVGPAPPPNGAPRVDAGADRTGTLSAATPLDGTVSDDGLPDPPHAVRTLWSLGGGPAPVTFDAPGSVDTPVRFTAAGTYLLRLTATDGALTAHDSVVVEVHDAATFESRVASGADDVEEKASGSVSATSSDLELVEDGGVQTIGLRFNGVSIPPGATILTAWVQFKADEAGNAAATLAVHGHAADSAPPFTSASRNVSGRARTAASVSWTPAAWTAVGEAGPAQRTPDLRAVLQEIVSRPGWSSGNSVALIVTGSGKRTAEAYEGDRAGAALLHVEYR